MITKEYLEDYKNKIGNYNFEIEKIEKQIMFEYKHASSDSVVGSTTTKPYIKRTIGISGIDRKKIKRLENRQDLFKKKRNKLNKELKYKLDNLEDRVIADIIEKKYINNISSTQIALDMNYASESGVRNALKRYFEKNKDVRLSAKF